mmetsp:Transcript_30393/g.116508  ORF Transcript_30393/g.116508 Transcript_30393/m.116508 type:complete len:414 (+) Transcript_30393:559-1800(+)
MLRESTVFDVMKKRNPDRFLALERSVSLAAVDVTENLFRNGSSKQVRRNELSKSVQKEVASVAPSRLLALLGQSLKYQHSQGLLPPGTSLDLFRDIVPELNSEDDAPCVLQTTNIKFGTKQYAECALFSPKDDMFLTGSSDGFVEAWDYLSGKYRTDLKYQAEDDLISHEEKICCMCFSREGEMLATGGAEKKLKVWRLRSGKVLRRIELVRAPSCMTFSRDGAQLLVGFPDGAVRIYGLKSGKILKELHGHTAIVNDIHYSADGASIFTGSADGTIRVWSHQTAQCIKVLRPAHVREGTSVLKLCPLPDDREKFLVCCRSPILQYMSVDGIFSSKIDAKTDVADACLSAKGRFIYAFGDDGSLRIFKTEDTSELLTEVKVLSSRVIGICHHPQKNALAVYGTGSVVHIMRPK